MKWIHRNSSESHQSWQNLHRPYIYISHRNHSLIWLLLWSWTQKVLERSGNLDFFFFFLVRFSRKTDLGHDQQFILSARHRTANYDYDYDHDYDHDHDHDRSRSRSNLRSHLHVSGLRPSTVVKRNPYSKVQTPNRIKDWTWKPVSFIIIYLFIYFIFLGCEPRVLTVFRLFFLEPLFLKPWLQQHVRGSFRETSQLTSILLHVLKDTSKLLMPNWRMRSLEIWSLSTIQHRNCI